MTDLTSYTRRLLDLNLAHIKMADSIALEDCNAHVMHGEYGHLLPLWQADGETTEGYWRGLGLLSVAHVCNFAQKRGFEFVLLDRDAEIVDELPHYEW